MLGPQHLLPGDLVDVIDLVTQVRYRWHATDAKHAVSVEPERYKLVEHRVSVEPHQPGYHAVTSHMLANGFNAPLRAQPEPEPEPEPEDEKDDDRE